VAEASAYVSFLIRMWREGGEHAAGAYSGWRSQLEHIQSGRRWNFEDLDDLLHFLRRQALDPGALLHGAEDAASTVEEDR